MVLDATRCRCVAAALAVVVVAALGASAAWATAPFRRGVLLKGTVVTMDDRHRVIRPGNVLVRGRRIVAVWRGARRPRKVRVGDPVVVAPRRGLIFPGLINLHDHPAYSMLPAWPAPVSDGQPSFGRPTGREPYANRYQWNGANGFGDVSDEHRRLVVAPHAVLVPGLGLDTEAVKWAEIRGLLGGQTANQGAAGDPSTDRLLARNVDGFNFGRDRVESRTFPGPDPALAARMRAGHIDAFIAHVAEGVRDSDRRAGDFYSSRAELHSLRANGLFSDRTVVVHGTALERSDFAAMRAARSRRSAPRGDGLGAKLVWSPLSNLLLYGRTANVYEALAERVTVSLGTDWSPSGSGNLLQELKVADIALRERSLLLGSRRLVPSLRSEKALDRTLVAMVTRNPARSLRWSDKVGSVEAGKVADLMVLAKPPRSPVRSGIPHSPYRSLIDATARDVRLTLVGGDPLVGDPGLMRSLKRADFETVRSARGGFAKAIDVTKPGVPNGTQPLATIEGALRDGLAALGGADGYAYLKARVGGGRFASASDERFRDEYLVPTFGTTENGRLNAEAIQLAPILPEDDDFRFRLIEGDRNRAAAIADATPPFGPYPANINQDPPGGGTPFDGFESRWYRAP
jgi:5-methylthioadenosine/S-adenosylhomocysteine deaminase